MSIASSPLIYLQATQTNIILLKYLPKSWYSQHKLAMANWSILFLFFLSLLPLKNLASLSPHPAYDEPTTCTINPISTTTTTGGATSDSMPRGTRILDITHPYRVGGMPTCISSDGLGQFLWLHESMANGSLYNLSELRLIVHVGTHVDAPGHMYQEYFEGGYDIDSLDLEVLNGTSINMCLLIWCLNLSVCLHLINFGISIRISAICKKVKSLNLHWSVCRNHPSAILTRRLVIEHTTVTILISLPVPYYC